MTKGVRFQGGGAGYKIARKKHQMANCKSAARRDGVRALSSHSDRIASASLRRCRIEINSTGTEFKYKPGVVVGGDFTHDCNCERGMGYWIEALLCLAPFAKNPTNVTLTGVTNKEIDIGVDLFRVVTLRLLQRFGVEASLKILQRGVPPEGGGKVFLMQLARAGGREKEACMGVNTADDRVSIRFLRRESSMRGWGVGCTPVGLWVRKGGSKKAARGRQPIGLPNPTAEGNLFLLRESGTVVPLLTSAASAPWCPSHAGAGDAPHKVFPKTVQSGGCSPPAMWEMQHRARGLRITECYPSAVHSMFRHFASRFWGSLPVQCAVGNSSTRGVRMGGSDNKGDGLASQPRRYRVPGQPLLNRHQVGGVSSSPDGLFAQQERDPIRGRPAVRGKRTYGGRPGQRVEEQGTWASRTQKHSEAGYGRLVDRGAWTAKTVK